MKNEVRYKFWATLLDAYQNYIDASDIYEEYWGFSDNPPFSLQEFQNKQYESLLDTINKVPFDSEAADKGTAFNEVIDCIVLHHNSDKMQITKERNDKGSITGVKAVYNNREFHFPLPLIQRMASYYKDGVPQQYVEATLPTAYGDVLLYGFTDYILPLKICDLKTTARYSVGKYKKHYQHLVYPYCLRQNGADVRTFEYNVVVMSKYNYDIYTETYLFRPDRDIPKLTATCEDIIRFLQDNKEKINNTKIFNLR